MPDLSTLFTVIPIKNEKQQLYKFFYYNEQLQKWEKNSELISKFIRQKNLNLKNRKLPLVFYSNSYENDLITLNSNLLLNLYPELDDNDIYVYALCERSISFLEYNINVLEETSTTKPIFLLLHVPESKRRLENIKTIIFKIYYFLSIVCDIEVVILNEEHYNEQIDLLKCMQNVKRSYKKGSQSEIERSNSIRSRFSQELSRSRIKFENDSISMSSNDDLSDDGDYFDFDFDSDSDSDFNDEDEVNQSNLIFDVNSMNGVLDFMDLHPFVKDSKQIILINNEEIEEDIIEVGDHEFSSNIREQLKAESLAINYINVNNSLTYRLFLKSLKEFSQDVENEYENIIKNFDLLPITEINSRYIQLKSKDNWENELENIINLRFQEYKKADLSESNDFMIISKLNKEIAKMIPSIDFVFHKKMQHVS